MTAAVKPVAAPEIQIAASGASDATLMSRFASRQSNEIVVAFAGPIGCGIKSVINATRRSLQRLNYTRVEVVKLSEFLDISIREKRVRQLDPEPGCSDQFYRYRRLQQAGRDIRSAAKNAHILAEYAVEQIVLDRARASASVASEAAVPVPSRVAYLIDQVKRPEEVELLRALYRNLFYLVGVTKPYEQRKKLLEDEGVDEGETSRLIEIDRNEEGDGGQQLDRTLHLADFFVRNDAQVDQRDAIDRFMRLIHGDKSSTPSRTEQGMYAAYAAGLRSACLSRQVGAAIANAAGEVVATGCNDVPAPQGGLYSSDSAHDFRCVHRDAICFNDLHKKELQEDIGRVIQEALAASLDSDFGVDDPPVRLSARRMGNILQSIYKKTRLGSLIEFSRSVHAEMDAIVSLARIGGAPLANATLYTTTFPCHSCARHIVAAGIMTVFYIEPYEKSMAHVLHEDAILFEFPPPAGRAGSPSSNGREMVKFLHFEGVSPRLFASLFRAESRKNKATGTFIPIEKDSPKVIPEYLDNYQAFEAAAVQHFRADLDRLPAGRY